MNPTISFLHVSKKYRIGRSGLSLRSMLTGFRKSQAESYHWALKDVDFELSAGDSMGIIGPNGAGKTTTLKLLSKVTYPTSGEIRVNGRLSALIELGAGFHPELTGRDNIYLNGSILGMSRSEVKKRFDQIVEFSGISEYLDTPVKRYSSGMYARLGFSVAAHVEPEVLLVDEVLAVGDMAFQRKCYDRMLELLKGGTTLIFVSHNLGAVQKICSRCIVLYRGRNVFDGSASEATAEYSNILRQAATEQTSDVPESGGLSQLVMSHAAEIQDVKLLRENGEPALVFQSGEEVRVRVQIQFNEQAQSPIFACTIRQPDGQIVYDYTTHWANIKTPDFPANSVGIIEYPITLNLAAGTYQLGTDLAYQDLSRYYDRVYRALDFVITNKDGARGIADLKGGFRVVETRLLELQQLDQ